jgi:hypothetical protein
MNRSNRNDLPCVLPAIVARDADTRNGGSLGDRKLAEGACAPTLTSKIFIALNGLISVISPLRQGCR